MNAISCCVYQHSVASYSLISVLYILRSAIDWLRLWSKNRAVTLHRAGLFLESDSGLRHVVVFFSESSLAKKDATLLVVFE